MSKKNTVKSAGWTKTAGNNLLLEAKDFYISYNPIAGSGTGNPIGDMAQMFGGMMNGELSPQEETALYDGSIWRILLGDFRKEYQEAFPSWDKCLAVYDKYKAEYRSEWSSDEN